MTLYLRNYIKFRCSGFEYLFCVILLCDHGDAAGDAIGEKESLLEIGGLRFTGIFLLYNLHDKVLIFLAGVLSIGAVCNDVQSVFCQKFHGGYLSCLLFLRDHLSIYHYFRKLRA